MSTTRRCAGHALALALLLLLVPGVGSAQGNRVDLRVLLVTDGDPPVEALRAHLARLGIPVDVLDLGDLGRRRIDDALLADGPHAHYQGVVLPDQAPTGLPPAELAALHSYEQRFGIRQLDASVTATPAVGLTEPTDTSATAARSTAVRRSSPPRPWPATSATPADPSRSPTTSRGWTSRGCSWPRRGPASCRC